MEFYQKVIGTAIKDLVSDHEPDREDSVKYVNSKVFINHCEMAGYSPAGLRDTLNEILSLSRPQQKVVMSLVMERLAQEMEELAQKKAPAGEGLNIEGVNMN